MKIKSEIPGRKKGLAPGKKDFSGLPLDDYLNPTRILGVEPLFFKDPARLSLFLQDQVKNRGVQGFAFGNEDFSRVRLDRREDAPGGKEDYLGRLCHHLAPWFLEKSPEIYFSIQAEIPKEFSEIETLLAPLVSSGLKLIQWKIDPGFCLAQSSLFWHVSKQGVWNHATGSGWIKGPSAQAKFIVNNPTLIHSFEDTAQDVPRDERGCLQVPRKLLDYGRVTPLPGIPFWEYLNDSIHLLPYLGQNSQKELAALRVDLDKNHIFSLGSQITFFYHSPQDLDLSILDEICKMVDAGGSVDITHVRSNLENAYLIGYAMENGVIIGNSSLKYPRQEFIHRINQITGLDFTHFVERGYTSVRPEYRSIGVGAELLAGLTQRAQDHKVFSIISEENLATQKIALRNRTRKIFTYFSDKLNKEMGVWMPESMIDTSLKIPGDRGDQAP